MGKLRVLSGKQVCNILSQHGFMEVRQRGSHIVMQKHLSNTTITVLVPNHCGTKKTGRQSGHRIRPIASTALMKACASSGSFRDLILR